MFQPVNGAPMTITRGTLDQSARLPVFERAPRAIHLPFQYLWAQWGPEHAQVVYGGSRELVYGGDTFDMRKKYANHATLFNNLFVSNANPVMIKRLIPADAPPRANLRLSVDVLEHRIDEIEREVDGSFKVNVSGDYVKTGTQIDGTTIKFIVEYIEPETLTKESNVGKGKVLTGDQVDGGAVSKRYPLFDFEVPHIGERGNMFGVRLWAPTNTDVFPVNDQMFTQDKVYPFRIAFVEKGQAQGTARIIQSNYGELFTEFCLKPGLVDTANGKERHVDDLVLNNYQDLAPAEGYPPKFGPFARLHTYQENIDGLLGKILENEKGLVYGQNELVAANNSDMYMVNLFGATTTKGVPYQSVRFAQASTGSVRLSENTTLWASGGGDGTMNDETFAQQVALDVAQWADPDSEYQDILGYPCSFLWDSGFPMDTKFEMAKFISRRKNTFVVLSTHVSGERALTASEESARTITLINRVRGYADSDFHGTGAFRFAVASRSGRYLSGFFRHRVGLAYDFADMVSKLAGSSKFKAEHLFDRVPNNIIRHIGDLNAPWVPAKVRNKDWANGMLWAERLTERQYYIPAARTGYKNDTSVLTSVITAMAIAECQTVGELAQKQFSGGNYTQGELKQLVEEYVRNELNGKFAELFVIIPEVVFSAFDEASGYSWTLNIAIYAGNMRTVEILTIESHRKDDLPQQHSGFVA